MKVKNNLLLFLTLGAFLALFALLKFTYPTIEVFHIENNQAKPITLPFEGIDTKEQTHFYRINVHYPTQMVTKFQLIPDDCVESFTVNNRTFVLQNEPNRCNFDQGFELNLEPYMREGSVLTLEIPVKNFGGKYSIHFLPNLHNGLFTVTIMIALLFIAILMHSYLRKKEFPPLITALFIGALFLRLYYLYLTPYSARTHDVDGHIEYILSIATQWWIPTESSCWQCYHPALYYMLGALWYKFSTWIDLIHPYKALQGLSLLFNLGFLFYGVALLKEFLSKSWSLILATALFLFWPSLVIHSARIGNDNLLYFFYAAALFHFIRYLKENASRELIIATLFASLAIATKTNGALVILCMGTILFIKLVKSCGTPAFKPLFKLCLSVALIFSLMGGVLFGKKIYDKIHTTSSSLIVSNAQNLHGGLRIQNSLDRFVYFDLKAFLTEPFADPWDDKAGRQYFWNYTLKTALTGEFKSFIASNPSPAGVLISLSGLVIFTTAFGTLLFRRSSYSMPEYFLILNILIPLAALMYIRVSIPFICSNDFRYIVPLLLGIIIFHIAFLERLHKEHFLTLLRGFVLLDLLLIASSIYLLS